ncbi:MAG TPA: ATP synthase F0 subunit B [Polyangiaceae bacterium]|nr:ATP synthase F0 subunit B [Polyangiaceae bacterium]
MSLLSDGFAGSAGSLLAPPLANVPLASVSIDLNKTVLLQMVIFAVLIVVLKPLLFDPILKVFALREERTEGAREQARKLQTKAGDLLTRYEQELERINHAVAVERDKARLETAKLEAEILNEAREVTSRVEREGRDRIQQEVTQMRAELQQQSATMAREIAGRILGREVAG